MRSLRWKLCGAGAAFVALTALACVLLLGAAREALRVPEERLRSAQELEALLAVSTHGSAYLARVGEALSTDVPDLEAVREARADVAAGLARLERLAQPLAPGEPAARPEPGRYRPLRDAFDSLDGRVRGALVPGQMRYRAALDGELALVEATAEQEWAPALAQAVEAARADAARVQGDAAERTQRLTLLLALLPAALALALLLLWGAALRPLLAALQALLEGAQRISRGERGVRVPVDTADEVGMLCSAFNRMAWELERVDALAGEGAGVDAEAARPLRARPPAPGQGGAA